MDSPRLHKRPVIPLIAGAIAGPITTRNAAITAKGALPAGGADLANGMATAATAKCGLAKAMNVAGNKKICSDMSFVATALEGNPAVPNHQGLGFGRHPPAHSLNIAKELPRGGVQVEPNWTLGLVINEMNALVNP